MYSLTTQTLAELRSSLVILRTAEREAIAEVVLYLAELDSRKAYRELGFSSLFAYCHGKLEVGGLGYSPGGAQRRVLAARALSKNGEIYTKLKEGKLTLSAVVELSQVLTEDNSSQLLAASEGKSKVEIQKLVAPYQPPQNHKKESIVARNVAPPKRADDRTLELFGISTTPPQADVTPSFRLSFEADEEFIELFEEAKVCSGVREMREVMRKALRCYLEKVSPRRRDERRTTRKPTPLRSSSKVVPRHIPRATRDRVHLRDEGRCTFVSPDGKRCDERCGLEMDHIVPFALGGRHEEANLRLMCRAHNRLMAEQVFGVEQMKRYGRAACMKL